MATSKPAATLPESLFFDPHWVSDPAPPWLFQYLSADVVRQLGRVNLEATAAILQTRLDATKKAIEIVARAK